MRKPTEAQRAIAKEKRERIRAMVQKISKLTPEERAQLTPYGLTANLTGHVLSNTNQCLLAFQGCQDNIVAGFQQWRKAGRIVKKGSTGFAIWVPIGAPKQDNEGPDPRDGKDIYFTTGTVFGISQTVELNQEEKEEPGEEAAA